MLKTGVFLDRDDTIIKDQVYLSEPDRIEILPGAAEAIALLNAQAIPVIVITNQSGIARGVFDEVTLKEIHRRMLEMFNEKGASIDGIYYCPHHPEGSIKEFTRQCECRKPQPGMLIRAASDFKLKLENCYMVGDKEDDIETIQRVGGKGVLISATPLASNAANADYTAHDLKDAVSRILKDMRR